MRSARSARRGGRSVPRACAALLIAALMVPAAVACRRDSEVPDGYQYATRRGERFRLFIPTQWTSGVASGVSGGYPDLLTGTAVTMSEVPAAEAVPGGGPEGEATLEAFAAAHTERIRRLDQYEEEKRFSAELDGCKATDMTYRAEIGGEPRRFRQILTKVEGRFYLFTFTSRADTFNRWLDTVDGILDNLQFRADPYEGGAPERKARPVGQAPRGMRLASGKGDYFCFYAPEGWIQDDESAVSLVYASEEDRSNVSMIAYLPDRNGVSVQAYWELCEARYKRELGGYRLLSVSEGETMGGRAATAYTFAYELGGAAYRCRQTVCVYGPMVCVMTYTALSDRYDSHLSEAAAMQAALTFRR